MRRQLGWVEGTGEHHGGATLLKSNRSTYSPLKIAIVVFISLIAYDLPLTTLHIRFVDRCRQRQDKSRWCAVQASGPAGLGLHLLHRIQKKKQDKNANAQIERREG